MELSQHIQDALELFLSTARVDVHAERFRQADGKWAYKPVAGTIGTDHLKKHLNGGPHLGVYIMPAGSAETRLAVLDLDDHGGVAAPGLVLEAASALARACRRIGLEAWAVRSGGGKGIHLCFRWDKPQPAAEVRRVLLIALATNGYRDGTGGVLKGEVEIFPKQVAIEPGGFGSLVAVPFGRLSRPLDENLIEALYPPVWISSQPVGNARKGEDQAAEAGGDLTTALRFLDSDDFQRWIEIGLALKHDLKEAGYKVWDEWSRQSEKYPGPDETKRWWNKLKPNGQIRLGSIYWLAREAGWHGTPGEAPPYSEEALALQFANQHGNELKHTAELNAWHRWNGAYWERDQTLIALNMAREVARAAAAQSNKRKQSIASSKTAQAVVSLARADRRIAARREEWDADVWLLGTPAGTVDLRTGTVVPADPANRITRATSVVPGGECPLWLKFLSDITNSNEDVQGYLRRLAGYCLTGSVKEHALVFFYGTGRNGKGTFIDTLRATLKDYAQVVAMTTLIQTKHQEHPTEIAKLNGARLAVAGETQDGARWNTGRIKQLTGGDPLTGRFMRMDYFDFDPTHKLVVLSNKKPLLGNVDDAIRGRIHLVPFSVKFATGLDKGERRADPDLPRKLREELSGILQWAIEGCREWQQRGLDPPQAVRDATEDYLHNQDDIRVWIDECCTLDSTQSTLIGTLYESWKGWAERSGAWAGGKNEFSQRLTNHGFEPYKVKGFTRFKGLRPATAESDQPGPEDQREMF